MNERKRKCSWETKRKINETLKCKTQGENNPFYGKHHSEETKQKISKSLKMRDTRPKKIICVETDEIFDSISEAARKYGLVVSHICSCCKGKRTVTGSYHWRYADE